MSSERLYLGDGFDLVPVDGAEIVPGCLLEVLSDDASFGNPDPEIVAIRSQLIDGSIEETVRYGNREMYFRLVLTAGESASLAQAEKALFLLVGKRTTLTWVPPDGWGAPSVFTITTSVLTWLFDDFDEAQQVRTYGIRLVALPFARAEFPTVVAAVDGPSGAITTSTIDNCSSATGWTSSNGSHYADLGQIWVSGPDGDRWLTRTGAVSTTTEPYVTIVHSRPSVVVGAGNPRIYADGVLQSIVAQSAVTVGSRRIITTTIKVPTGFTTLKLNDIWTDPPTAVVDGEYAVDNISKSNAPPYAGTGRQKIRTLEIGGSARTDGSLAIAHPSQGLGEVLAYMCPLPHSGYSPDLRRRRVSGPLPVTDTARISGAYENIATSPVTFDFPIIDVHEGVYSLMMHGAKVSSVTTRIVTWTAQAYVAGTAVGELKTGTARFTGNTGQWRTHSIARIVLPTINIPPTEASIAVLRVTLSSDLALSFDEGWLFDLTRGALTFVDCGTGTPAPGTVANRLWIEAPTVDKPRPSLYVGNAADMSDASYPSMLEAWGEIKVEPGTVQLTTVTPGGTDASAEFTYYKNFFTHVVEE